MSNNKKLTLEELKIEVFERNNTTKKNKDRLFKLAKASEDLETIKKLSDDFAFKSAKMYLNKLDKLSIDEAIKNRNFELFNKFVNNGADISKIKVADLIDKKYNDEFIKFFIQKDYYVNIAQLVKKNYHTNIIKFALDNKAKIDDIYKNLTALAHASVKGRINIVKLLLEYKPNINKQFLQGFNALFFAITYKNNEIVTLLVENGADIEIRISQGFTPLILAASDNNIDTVKLLLEKGADINAQTANKGTALILAVIKNNVEIVKLLLEYNPDINMTEGIQGVTALDLAIDGNNQEIIHLLEEHGAKESESEELPELFQAFIEGNESKIKRLLELNHDINQEFNNSTALIQSAGIGDIAVVNSLLDSGADIDYKTEQGFTALIMAVEQGHYEIAKTLTQRGANQNIKGYAGFTALDAAIKNNSNIAELLKGSKSFNINESDYLKDQMKARAENDYKELIANKVEELGVDKAKEYLENISSQNELLKEIGTLKNDSTPFIEKSLRRKTLSNEEMSKDIIIKGVGTYDGAFIHESLRGVKFTSIQTNIGYFLDFPYQTSIINPDTRNKLPDGIDWNNCIGTIIKEDGYITFTKYSNHIFINFKQIDLLENRCFYSYKNDAYELIEKIQNYDYDNTVMYDEFFSLIETFDNINNDMHLEKYYIENCQYLDVDKLNIQGNTALLSASWWGNVEVLNLLGSWGADINFQNKEGYTALMLATDRGHYEICKILLENGANPSIKNHRGQDSSIFAIKSMNLDIINLLEEYDIEIKNTQQYIVDSSEEKHALEISKLIEQKIQTKGEISEFLIFALNYNYEWELDLDYYIKSTNDYLVSIKPSRETRFTKKIVDIYYDMHKTYLDKINVSDESKNRIRIKIFDTLMGKYQLGKYENSKFEEVEGENFLYTLKLKNDEVNGDIDVFVNHITLKILDTENNITSFEYKKQKENHYYNENRGEIIITKKSIIEKDKSGGQRISKYTQKENEILDINKTEHNSKALSNILKKFSSNEKLKYTNHPWDVDKFNNGQKLTYDNFMKNLEEAWDEIKDDLHKLSKSLYEKIDRFLFDENEKSFSHTDIKRQLRNGKKPENILFKDGSNFQDKMDEFKSLFVIKQNDRNLKLLKKFTKLRKKLDLSIKLNLDNLKDDNIDKFFTDVETFESALSIILKDINENADEDKKDVVVTAEEPKGEDYIEVKIIHINSISSQTSDRLKETIDENGGNFKSIYDSLKSLCDWSIDTICSDKKRYKIDFLYPDIDNNKPHIIRIDETIEEFTHILRFKK